VSFADYPFAIAPFRFRPINWEQAMNRSGFTLIDLLVYLAQCLLVIPIVLLLRPLPHWLINERHWSERAAVALFALLTALLWMLLVILITVSLIAIQKRLRR
jgi:hypothetical protein